MREGFTRKFSEEERVKIVEEVLECGSNSLIAARYDLNPVLLSKWKSSYRKYGKTIAPKKPKEVNPEDVIPDYKKAYKKSQNEVKELKTEVAILRDLLKKKTKMK